MRSVDLPMPGSPPTRVTEPGTMPPPSTKSNSASPVFHRVVAADSISDSRTGEAPDELRPSGRRAARPPASSISEFHAPQASQRPPHFGWSAPHSVQRNTDLPLAMGGCRRRREVVEPGEFFSEDELRHPRRAVALLSDDYFGEALDTLVRFGVDRPVVKLLAIDEAHDIGVLLDRAGLAQIRQLRPPVLAATLLRRARELRDREDRHIQLLGERLERARDVGDLLLAVFD